MKSRSALLPLVLVIVGACGSSASDGKAPPTDPRSSPAAISQWMSSTGAGTFALMRRDLTALSSAGKTLRNGPVIAQCFRLDHDIAAVGRKPMPPSAAVAVPYRRGFSALRAGVTICTDSGLLLPSDWPRMIRPLQRGTDLLIRARRTAVQLSQQPESAPATQPE